MERLKELVQEGEAEETAARAQLLLDEGGTAETILKEGLVPAMDVVGELFQEGKYFLPEMLIAARAMKAGMEVLKPVLARTGGEAVGKVVIGTVKGDMHDIGKNLVALALEGAAFKVIDLGLDVPPEKFVEAIKEHGPVAVGCSALITTTMVSMGDTVRAIEDSGLRDRVKIMIGGAPVNQEFCDEIGADFYGPDSTAGKDFARCLVS